MQHVWNGQLVLMDNVFAILVIQLFPTNAFVSS